MNEEQKRENIINNLNSNMFVEAGAGAGKTTLIVRRIVKMLEAGKDPSKIVVITFTNKAAEELRGRIIAAVKKGADSQPNLGKALQSLDRMNISTIHSFCYTLLKEQGLSMQLPPDLELLEKKEAFGLVVSYLNKYLRGISEKDWKTLETLAGSKVSRYSIKEKLKGLYLQIAEQPMDTEYKIGQPKVDANALEDALRLIIDGDTGAGIPSLQQRILDAVSRCINQEENKNGFEVPDTLSELMDAEELWSRNGENMIVLSDATIEIFDCYPEYDYEIGEWEDDEYDEVSVPDYEGIYEKLIPILLSNTTKRLDKNDFLKMKGVKLPFDKERIKDVNDRLKEELRNTFGEDNLEVLRLIAKQKDEEGTNTTFREKAENLARKEQYFQEVWRHALAAKELYRRECPRRYVTNDRLLEYTRDLILQEDGRALCYFSTKYDHFFVDEFQDTDRLQAEFIYRLAAEPDDPNTLRNGALFVVGDPKQSIYRFRGAQPEVYFDIKEKMHVLSNAEVYELQQNFRSGEAVIDWVNKKFTESDSITPIVIGNYRYQNMVNKIASCEGDDVIRGIYHLGEADAVYHRKDHDSVPVYGYAQGDQRDDVEQVVSLVTGLVGKKKITDYDSNHNAYSRDVRFDDFLLLSQEKKNMELYVEALQNRGIPVLLDGKEDLRKNRALVVFVRLFHYLVNPREPFFRVGALEALRETLHCDTEEELLLLSNHILDCLYEDAKHMTPYGKAMYLERQVSVLYDKENVVSKITAQKAQSVIRQMIETIFPQNEGTGVELAALMNDYLDRELEHELPLKEGMDSVRFMNLHKAKGLEGNIVVLLDRRGKKNEGTVHFQDGKIFYPGIKGLSSISDNKKLKKSAEDLDAAEFHRLEYVAVTRAKQAFIFMPVLKKGGLFATKKLKTSPTVTINDETFYKNEDATTYQYEIDKETDIEPLLIGDGESEEKADREFVDYSPTKDDYTNYYEVKEKIDEMGRIIKESPSGLENSGSSLKKQMKEENKENGYSETSQTMHRPIGNIVGDILHRTMELMVSRGFALYQSDKWNGNPAEPIFQKVMETCCYQALEENKENVLQLNESDQEAMEPFIFACEKAYAKTLSDWWQDIVAIYPEVKFSYLAEGIPYAKKKEAEEDNGSAPCVDTWMNGTADLILKMKDGKYRLVDYKSDNDFGLDEEQMEELLKEKYTPQLNVYREVIENLLKAEPDQIETMVVSFSMKDEYGNALTGEKMRTRVTEIIDNNV